MSCVTSELYRLYRDSGCRVSTDSRHIEGGEIFFALRGESFDGNNFALKALSDGASYAVVNDDVAFDDPRLVKTPSPLRTLTELAVYHREHVRGDVHLPVVGLTGTNGKTTTKNLIEAVLSHKFKVTATKGNLNNDIGVPLSLLSIRPDTEIAVIEMGANHPEDIAKLVAVSRPDYGLITNVGKAHLLGFGSLEGVKAAKGELYKWLGTHEGSLIFINEDDSVLLEMSRQYACHQFGYGIKYQGAEILPATPEYPYLRMILDGHQISTGLVGAYNASNVLAAIAVGDYFGVPREGSISAIESFIPSNNRSQMIVTERNSLIVDAYNANPSSMLVAIENFASVVADKKLALLGDMRELGDDSLAEHVCVIRKLSSLGIEAYLVGTEFGKALDVSGGDGFRWFADSSELASYLSSSPVSGCSVLVKGSRSMEMEKVLQTL